jgi:amino acid permease
MLESLRHQVNLPAVFIVFGAVMFLGALGLWLVRRSTGRPMREMLALLAAAFVIIAFMFPLVLFFDEWSRSPDLAIREFVKTLITIIILPIAFVVWRFFNRLSKPRRSVDSRGQNHNYHEPTT